MHSDPQTANIPVIILTGHDFKMYLEHSARAEGAVAYLMKPTFPDQLVREIAARLVKSQTSTDGQRALS